MSTPRPIRIPRRPASGASEPGPDPSRSGASSDEGRVPVPERRTNRAGTQRAVRLTVLYLACLALLYTGFVLIDRTVPGGSSSPAGNGLDTFSALAAILAVGGSLLSLHPAPRSVEVSAEATVVVGRWGRRHTYPPLDRIDAREVRRYPAGLLSSAPVVSVELSGGPSPLGTFLVEDGLVPIARRAR